MRRLSAVAFVSLVCAGIASPQRRAIDWPAYGNDAQRTGWEKSDSAITKENVKDFQLVVKRKFDKQGGPNSLTPPVVLGRLISYRGFKELAFLAGGSDAIWSIDADTDKIFWERRLGSEMSKATNVSEPCRGGLAAMPALTPPVAFGGRRSAAASAAPAAPRPAPTPPGGRLVSATLGALRPVFALSSDGKLHLLNVSTGEEYGAAVSFLPAHAKASSLTLSDGVIYTTTNSGCGGAPNAVWAIDLNQAEPKPVSFDVGGSIDGLGGFAAGADGTILVQVGSGRMDPDAGKWSDSILALSPKDLKVKQYFTAPGLGSVTPVAFAWKGKELVVAAGKNGRLYLLDQQSLGGTDHKTALYDTASLSSGGVWGGLSSWEDADGVRWVLAPVWNALSSDLKSLAVAGDAPNGSVVAFRLEEQNGKPVLTPAWVSRDMNSPEPPVITSGVVFALSAGQFAKGGSRGSGRAVLYALDAATGKEMYSSGSQVGAPANLNGVTLANGRVFFTTTDNTLYAFGIFLER